MYGTHQVHPYYSANPSTYAQMYSLAPYRYQANPQMHCPTVTGLRDYGPLPFTINIDKATTENNAYRIALWTGKYLQLTLMSINVGDEIGLEVHDDHDQFIRIEQGQGIVKMGDSPDPLIFQAAVYDDYAIFIPAGKWHNLINVGCVPLKLYSIYAPPEHPWGTVHLTKEDAEYNHGY